jgi:hypothetical protein
MSQNPSVTSRNIVWERIPAGLRESMRAAAWIMFRQALPEALVEPMPQRRRLSDAHRMRTVCPVEDRAGLSPRLSGG